MKIDGEAKTIAAAFIKARGEMNATVTKDAKGNYGKYATLAAIVEATTDALAHHGLAVVQEASADEHGVCVETWLIHESGATMQFSPLTMPLGDRKPQAVGSAITYARRYALGAICGLAPDDDDGQAAQDATRTTQKPQQAHHSNGTGKAPQRQVEPSTGEIIDALTSGPLASPDQLRRLNEIGLEYYKAGWPVAIEKWIIWATDAKAGTPEQLNPEQADAIIEAIEKRIAKRLAEVEAA